MAVLGTAARTHEITLGSRTLVGRSAVCAVRHGDRRVSSEHAALSWSGLHWQLRDFGSYNGTRVNGKRLPPGATVPVGRGDVFEFGCPEACWVLLDDGPPLPFARSVRDGRTIAATDGWLLLPSAEEPRACVTRSDQRWILESSTGKSDALDQATVDAGGESFRLYLPPPRDVEATSTGQPQLYFRELTLEFRVSLDEEHVEICLCGGRRDQRLAPRAHHYMLLTLARAKRQDRGTLRSESDMGWVHAEALATSLRVDVEKLNVDIFRARRQFLQAGVVDAEALVERRHNTRSLRFGPARFEIRRGSGMDLQSDTLR